MGLEQFANNPTGATVTLANSYTAGGTTIVVSSTSVFPTSPPYRLIVDPNTSKAEIMYVTAVAGTTLTVTTGYEGTSNVNHSSGAIVAHVETAGVIQTLWNISAFSISVTSYGAIPDCRRLTDITATSGSASITSAGAANFTQADVGKLISLYDFTNSNYVFRGTLASVQSATAATLSGTAGNSLATANTAGFLGTDNSTAFQQAFTASAQYLSPVFQNNNLSRGGGDMRVLFPTNVNGNIYAFSQQLLVPTNVTIDADAMLVSMVGSATTNAQGQGNRLFSIIGLPGANIRNLQISQNYTQGMNWGVYGQQTHTRIDQITQWQLGSNNASGNGLPTGFPSAGGSGYVVGDQITLTGGTATVQAILQVTAVTSGAVTQAVVLQPGVYSVVPSNPVSQGSTTGSGTGATFTMYSMPNSQMGMCFAGNDYFINEWWSEFGNLGLALAATNDLLANSLFPIGASIGFYAQGGEQIRVSQIQCDTNAYQGIDIENCHCVTIADGLYFAVNSTSATSGFNVGQVLTNASTNLNINFCGQRGGGDGARLNACSDSRFRFNFCNDALFAGGGTGGVAIVNGVNFTGAQALTGNILVDLTVGTVGTGTITPKTGTGYGMFLLNGNPLYSVQTPSSGNTITIDSATPNLILNPAGTLSTLTVNMPANPMDAMMVRIGSDQGVTVLTVGGNGNTIKNAPTTLAAGGGLAWQYNKSGTTWYRIQ